MTRDQAMQKAVEAFAEHLKSAFGASADAQQSLGNDPDRAHAAARSAINHAIDVFFIWQDVIRERISE